MKVEEALPILSTVCGKKVSQIVDELPSDLRIAKGRVGQLLELFIGLKASTGLTDFTDGELKTNKTRADGTPAETIFITQIRGIIDTLLDVPPVPFEQSSLRQKIQNLVVVQVIREGPETEWRFGHVFHVNLLREAEINARLEEDYYTICAGLREHVLASGTIHTTSGDLIQVRSKDFKPYRPMYSRLFRRQVANKDHAFYFKKEFMLMLLAAGSRYRICC